MVTQNMKYKKQTDEHIRNRERDNLINKGLKQEGISVNRFWECEINKLEWQLSL